MDREYTSEGFVAGRVSSSFKEEMFLLNKNNKKLKQKLHKVQLENALFVEDALRSIKRIKKLKKKLKVYQMAYNMVFEELKGTCELSSSLFDIRMVQSAGKKILAEADGVIRNVEKGRKWIMKK